ncbi:hypothetical protein ACFQE1_00205 [Halobium palmae]|uniref:Uncharacterized protein n=1 Tax=Halobium palmae TaxID=1776492 RepID=A0ABD5RUJ1_9EURY
MLASLSLAYREAAREYDRGRLSDDELKALDDFSEALIDELRDEDGVDALLGMLHIDQEATTVEIEARVVTDFIRVIYRLNKTAPPVRIERFGEVLDHIHEWGFDVQNIDTTE